MKASVHAALPSWHIKISGRAERERIFRRSEFPVRVDRWHWAYFQRGNLRYHPELEMHFIKRGEGLYRISGHDYAFSRHALIVIPPGEGHAFALNAAAPFEKYMLIFQPAIVRRTLAKVRFMSAMPHLIHITGLDYALLELDLQQIIRELKNKEIYWQDMVLKSLSGVLLYVKRVSSRVSRPTAVCPWRDQLIGYIDEHYTQPLQVAALAAVFGYSPDYLSRAFKVQMDVGLKQYILQRRIDKAQKLLEKPMLKITAIGRMVGFNDFGQFNRAFQKFTGLPPQAYRASHRGISQ